MIIIFFIYIYFISSIYNYIYFHYSFYILFSDGRVDHIFVSKNVKVEGYRVGITERSCGRTYSDHFPVLADIKLEAEKKER